MDVALRRVGLRPAQPASQFVAAARRQAVQPLGGPFAPGDLVPLHEAFLLHLPEFGIDLAVGRGPQLRHGFIEVLRDLVARHGFCSKESEHRMAQGHRPERTSGALLNTS